MDDYDLKSLKQLITKTLNECVDPDILDLIYKLLSTLTLPT